MKKTYNSPTLESVTLQSQTQMCAASLPVGRDDQSGTEQLSKKFWGSSIFEDDDTANDDEEPLL